MIVEANYRGYRINVHADLNTSGQWDAIVRICPLNREENIRFGRLTCSKPTAELAEQQAAVWARSWVDLYGVRIA
jgi:hypothetical protein